MKRTLINDPFRNPFHNRFHVPVHSRLDEMHAYTHMVWLHDATDLDHAERKDQQTRQWGRAFAGAFALVLFVVISAAYFSG